MKFKNVHEKSVNPYYGLGKCYLRADCKNNSLGTGVERKNKGRDSKPRTTKDNNRK